MPTGSTLAARRTAFAALALAIVAGLLVLALRVLAPGGWTVWEALTLLCLLGTLPWVAICGANAALGLALRLGARDPAAAVLPALRRLPPSPPRMPTAIAMCIRNEDMAGVLPPLARLLAGLDAARASAPFTLWFLSDTADPALAAAETAAIAAFRARHSGWAGRIHHRRRAANTGFKAGNVMDFLDHHAGDAQAMVCLDADSEMSAAAVLRLVACLEAEPRLAIVQQLIVGRPATAAFPRLFQFGMRAGMRIWATGQAWWQGPEGPYWGHNAAIRIAPFRQHARLAPLADGRAILSHDQVEAVRLHAAGWQVACLPDEAGSLEGNPPGLREFLARDDRWAAGNMQYLDLLRAPGLTPMGRWQLIQAMLMFVSAGLWLGVLVFAVLNAATGGGEATDPGALLALLLAGWAALHAPKLAGYAELLARPTRARAYGGRRAVTRGAAAELLFTTLLDPIGVVNKALFLLRLATGAGARPGWAPQQRADRGIGWADAARLLWPHTLVGAGLAALLAAAAPGALLWAAPFLAGLVLAVPFCVATAGPGLSGWLRATGLAATPEERAPAPPSAAPGSVHAVHAR